MTDQPGGVSRFTTALDPFCFGTLFIWWPKIRLPKITAQFCALVHKPLHIRRGVHAFVETQSVTVTPPRCFSLAYIFVTLRKC